MNGDGRFSFTEIVKMVIPFTLLLAGGLGAFYAQNERIAELRGQIGTLQLIQDVTERAINHHEELDGHPGMQSKMQDFSKTQAVLEERTKTIQNDVSEVKALLKDAARSLNEIKRNQ